MSENSFSYVAEVTVDRVLITVGQGCTCRTACQPVLALVWGVITTHEVCMCVAACQPVVAVVWGEVSAQCVSRCMSVSVCFCQRCGYHRRGSACVGAFTPVVALM